MLEGFLRQSDIDVLFLQEVTHPNLDVLRGYKTHYIVGTRVRGTAIVTRDEITLSNITKLPLGRAIPAEFREIWMDNIYAPSVAARRQESERFYNCELTYLLRKEPAYMILGGEFNCIFSKTDTTGHYKYSRALAELVHGFALRDAWQAKPARRVYTHFSQTRATRIDRLYASQELLSRKTNAETEAAAFTGHLAVVLRLSVDIPILRRGRGK